MTGMKHEWKMGPPLAYRGKEGCENFDCTYIEGSSRCYDWHCSYCDAPCSSQGHFGCEVGETLRAAAKRNIEGD